MSNAEGKLPSHIVADPPVSLAELVRVGHKANGSGSNVKVGMDSQLPMR